jgi:hypothetical protein
VIPTVNTRQNQVQEQLALLKQYSGIYQSTHSHNNNHNHLDHLPHSAPPASTTVLPSTSVSISVDQQLQDDQLLLLLQQHESTMSFESEFF